ncbi:putative protein CHAPERONE-LIKE PROTEIN OF POR1 [Helianthus debilis subsp. tardiflorus]
MNLSGLTGSHTKYCFHLHLRGPALACKRASGFQDQGTRRDFLCLESDARDVIFPRISINDPYKRLGISKEASEDEIQSARTFLVQKYVGHKPGVEAIESTHNKIIMQKLYKRKNPKINLKKKMREVSQSRVVQSVTSRFRTPTTNFIVKTSVAFVVLAALTVLFPTAPFSICVRQFCCRVGTFIVSWLLGTFLMLSVIPPVLKGPRSLEVTTSLVTYTLLWVSSTYLK